MWIRYRNYLMLYVYCQNRKPFMRYQDMLGSVSFFALESGWKKKHLWSVKVLLLRFGSATLLESICNTHCMETLTWKSKTGCCCCCCCVTVRYNWIGNSVLLCDRIEVPKWYRTGTISITNKGSVMWNFTATFNRLNLIWPYNSNVGV